MHGKSWKFVVWARINHGLVRGMIHGMVFGMVPVGSFLSPWLFLVCMPACGQVWPCQGRVEGSQASRLRFSVSSLFTRCKYRLSFTFFLFPLLFLVLFTIDACGWPPRPPFVKQKRAIVLLWLFGSFFFLRASCVLCVALRPAWVGTHIY